MTNSLCIHYVAHHRSSVPLSELETIGAFDVHEEDPSEDELLGPHLIAASTGRMVDASLGSEMLKRLCEFDFDSARLSKYLQSYTLKEREDAEDLFQLLGNIKFSAWALPGALRRVDLDAKEWSATALRLPNWNRAAWLPLMIELLEEPRLTNSERRCVALHFRQIRSAASSTPARLLELRDTTQGDFQSAVSLAIRQFNEE